MNELKIRRPAGPPQLAPLIHIAKGEAPPDNAGLWTEESLAALQRYLRETYNLHSKTADNLKQVSQIVFNVTDPGTVATDDSEIQADIMSKISLGF